MNSIDKAYAGLIDSLIPIIGYEAAYLAVSKAVLDSLNSTMRQAMSGDGAFAVELGQLAKEYPYWSIKFDQPEGKGLMVILQCIKSENPNVEREAQELQDKSQAIFAKYNKVKIPGVRLTSKLTRTMVPNED